jgi:S-adenosylmethionine hydrolase
MSGDSPVYLFTDFGWQGPYVGQMLARIAADCPECRVISLMHDAPAMRPDLAAYLLPAVTAALPRGGVVVAVVDPGVGSGRAALVVHTTDRVFVGPDNGLLSRLPDISRVERVLWRPPGMSATFHGRDLFAPVAARIARRAWLEIGTMATGDMVGADWPGACARVIYVDAYGNLMTGLDPASIDEAACLAVGGRQITHARIFSDLPADGLFWYINSQGLVEIAARGASASQILALELGDPLLLD